MSYGSGDTGLCSRGKLSASNAQAILNLELLLELTTQLNPSRLPVS